MKSAICAVCERPIEPEPRFWDAAGRPVHMLCTPGERDVTIGLPGGEGR